MHLRRRSLRPERSLQEPLICPGLEELILDPGAEGGRFGIQSVVAVAAVRARSGWEWLRRTFV